MGVKFFVNELFFDTWSNDMAYVLGFIYADGSLEQADYIRGRYLRMTSTDKDIILLIKNLLASRHTVVKTKPNDNNHKDRFLLRIGSHKIYRSLTKKGLWPNKSLTMQFPDVPKKYLGHFIRGYFDGDGHVSIELSQKRFKRLRIVFTCGSANYINHLALLIHQTLNTNISRTYQGHRAYRLAYSTRDSIKIFKYIYKDSKNLFLERKALVFKNFFAQYSKWSDSKTKKIVEAMW